MSTTKVHHQRPQGTQWACFRERMQLAQRRAREALDALVVRENPRDGSTVLELGTSPHQRVGQRPRAWMLALDIRLGNVRFAAALARGSR